MVPESLKWPCLVSADPDVAGVAQQALLERAPDAVHGSLHGVNDGLFILVHQVPEVSSFIFGYAGGWHLTRAAPRQILDELAAGRRSLRGIGAHRPANGPVHSFR